MFSYSHTFSVQSSCPAWRWNSHCTNGSPLKAPFTYFILALTDSLASRTDGTLGWHTDTHTHVDTVHEWTSLATSVLFSSCCGGRDHTRPPCIGCFTSLYTCWIYRNGWPTDPAGLRVCIWMCAYMYWGPADCRNWLLNEPGQRRKGRQRQVRSGGEQLRESRWVSCVTRSVHWHSKQSVLPQLSRRAGTPLICRVWMSLPEPR